MKTVAFFVGIGAVILYFVGYLQKARSRIILFNVSSRLMYIVQYLLLGAWEGAALDIAGAISSLIAGRKDAVRRRVRVWIFVAAHLLILAAGAFTYRDALSLLPVAGVLLHTGAFWLTDEKIIRRVSLLGSPFWLVYNFVSGAYGSCIGDVLSMVSIVVSMMRYDSRKSARGISGQPDDKKGDTL